MKLLSLFAFLLLGLHSSAQELDSEKTMQSLSQLGVRGLGGRVMAMTSIGTDANGNRVEKLSVFFSRPAGAMNLQVTDVTVFESQNESFLVMTFQASTGEQNSIATKTSILPVNSEASSYIAEVVKANATAVDVRSGGSLKIKSYSVEKIACTKVIYPGAQANCTVTKRLAPNS